jgi:hypothetical protein
MDSLKEQDESEVREKELSNKRTDDQIRKIYSTNNFYLIPLHHK